MSESQFLTFRKFNELALAEPIIAILQKHNIEYELTDSPVVFNPSFTFNEELSKEYDVKIKPDDFDRVNNLVLEDEAQQINNVDSDYYLFAFSDEELMDVLINYDEWNAFDFALARKLLNERGVPIDDGKIKEIKAKRFEVLQKPEETEKVWIVIGYISAFLGGLIGIFIGWYLSTAKKTLPNGERVYFYLDSDRKHGNRIFFIGIVVFIIAVIVRFYTATHNR